MSKPSTLEEIIIAYRKLIEERYQYPKLKNKYELPPFFNEVRTDLFKGYFLDHLYPAPEKRKELNEAFDNLDDYIKHPEKLLRVLIDSGSLIFKYGRHLPKILIAGLKAMRSFREASKLEETLVQSAISFSLEPPFSQTNIKKILASLDPHDLDEFMKNNEALFETLHDRKLVKKIIEIVGHIISKMKKRPQIYSESEIKALTMGQDIIAQGDLLFDKLSEEEQGQTLDLIMKIEKDFLVELFEN